MECDKNCLTSSTMGMAMQQKKVHANTALIVLRSSQHACTLDFMVATQFHFIMYVAIIISRVRDDSIKFLELKIGESQAPSAPLASSNRGI